MKTVTFHTPSASDIGVGILGINMDNMFSHMAETANELIPSKGMKVTINYDTDRTAATVVVLDSVTKIIGVKCNAVRCINYSKSEYRILDKLIGGIHYFTKRGNKRWVRMGDDDTTGLGLTLGEHSHYVDNSIL